ncbi:MAG: NAD(P)H-dependent glycerol-3-phosphate dehydrogenase [Anaerolineales bacterium]
MSIITIVGAGMMGTAMCWPLADNRHEIRLVGTPLDNHIITSLQKDGFHPTLKRVIPDGVRTYHVAKLESALEGSDWVISGVSSFGVEWFACTVGAILKHNQNVLSVTKGLEDQPNGDLLVLPEATRRRLPLRIKDQIKLNAIGGPCIAHELAARRQTAVVFTGEDRDVLKWLRSQVSTSYYHISLSTDVVGVEVCAAMKNAYALAVGLAVGMMEAAGPDGLAQMYNPQAALFGQSVIEIRRLLSILGGSEENAVWLPGPGDLYVTVFGGRTVRLGKLLGKGVSFTEARQQMAGVTLESVEITTRVARSLPKLAKRGLLNMDDFPLLRHLDEIVNQGMPVDIPWENFRMDWL